MAEEIRQMRQKYDTAANWTANNPTLAVSEIGVEKPATGSLKLKIGDGVTAWTGLPYFAGESNIIYNSGVLAAAAQTITPTGLTDITECEVTILHKNTNGTGEGISLFVNSDTTATNYNRQILFGAGSSVSATNLNAPEVGFARASSKMLSTFKCHIIDGVLFFQGISSRENGAETELLPFAGIKTAGTITDLSGMTLVTANANGFGIGSKVIVRAL